jgi:nucleoside-diphosphate-sugar epimerase
MRVLVTGANGFVGKALRAQLLIGGASVHAAIRSHGDPTVADRSFFVGPVGSATDWSAALQQVEVVVHLAARVHVMSENGSGSISLYREVNTIGTLKLVQDAARAGAKRFVFISSAKVNGEVSTTGKPFRETDAPAPGDAYSLSKYEAEEALKKFSTKHGMEVVIIRPPLVYGPGVKANFAALMRAVQRGMPLPLGAVRNLRSLVGLDNLVDFIITCVGHPAAANQTFLVSDGADISTPDLVRAMARAASRPVRLLPVPVGVLATLASLLGKRAAVDRLCSSLQLDISKARELLQWSPPVTLDEGLRRAFAEATP